MTLAGAACLQQAKQCPEDSKAQLTTHAGRLQGKQPPASKLRQGWNRQSEQHRADVSHLRTQQCAAQLQRRFGALWGIELHKSDLRLVLRVTEQADLGHRACTAANRARHSVVHCAQGRAVQWHTHSLPGAPTTKMTAIVGMQTSSCWPRACMTHRTSCQRTR